MKILTRAKCLALLLVMVIQLILLPSPKAFAATTPSLGTAATFGILSNTYTNTVGGTTITGDLGYTTGPAVAPTVGGTTYSPPSSIYTTAGIDQTAALSTLNSQPCDFTFGSATALNSLPQPLTPGVYCITDAASIDGVGITLNGSGTYIFRMTGALNTTNGTTISLTGGASACDIFWTPIGATTLGANSTFAGTVIDAAGITIGSTVTWTGRALAFGGTVSTDTDTLTTPVCATPTSSPSTTTTSTSSSAGSSTTSGSSGGSSSSVPSLTYVAPTIIESRRVDADSIYISWGPYSGTDNFIIQYGLENGKWLYSVNVTGFSTTLNDLAKNQPIWIRIAARNATSIGNYGEPKFVGGPSLPNAGEGSLENNFLSYIPSGPLSSFLIELISL